MYRWLLMLMMAIATATSMLASPLLVPGEVMYAQCQPRTDWATYTVQRGETLFRIARRYNTTVAVLMSANCLTNANRIYAGQVLRVPGTSNPGPIPVEPGNVRVLGTVVNLRSGPGTSHPVIGSLRVNDRVNPMARSADANWIKVGTQVGATGWVFASLLEIDGGWINRLPVENVVASPAYQAHVPGYNVPILAGPSDASGVIAYATNEMVSAIGRNWDSNWVYIRTSYGVEGWMWSYNLVLDGTLIASLPVR